MASIWRRVLRDEAGERRQVVVGLVLLARPGRGSATARLTVSSRFVGDQRTSAVRAGSSRAGPGSRVAQRASSCSVKSLAKAVGQLRWRTWPRRRRE